MENIIIVFVGIIAFIIKIYIESVKDTPQKESAETPADEVFPEIELLDADVVVPEPKITPVKKRNTKPIIDVLESVATKIANKPVEENKHKEKASRSKRVSLSTKSEAKRAFIYSEIFSRKY